MTLLFTPSGGKEREFLELYTPVIVSVIHALTKKRLATDILFMVGFCIIMTAVAVTAFNKEVEVI